MFHLSRKDAGLRTADLWCWLRRCVRSAAWLVTKSVARILKGVFPIAGIMAVFMACPPMVMSPSARLVWRLHRPRQRSSFQNWFGILSWLRRQRDRACGRGWWPPVDSFRPLLRLRQAADRHILSGFSYACTFFSYAWLFFSSRQGAPPAPAPFGQMQMNKPISSHASPIRLMP